MSELFTAVLYTRTVARTTRLPAVTESWIALLGTFPRRAARPTMYAVWLKVSIVASTTTMSVNTPYAGWSAGRDGGIDGGCGGVSGDGSDGGRAGGRGESGCGIKGEGGGG